jgi:spore coat protein U-like protein
MLLAAPAAANAQLACSVSLTELNFGTIQTTASGTYDTRGSIVVTCTGSQGAAIGACVDIAPGAVDASGLRMLSPPKGQNGLAMQIYQDATLARPWGGSAMGQAFVLQRTGDGPMIAQIYARLFAPRGAPVAGTYASALPVTLRYGFAGAAGADCAALGGKAAPQVASSRGTAAPAAAVAAGRKR